jgi:hypothetical protein
MGVGSGGRDLGQNRRATSQESLRSFAQILSNQSRFEPVREGEIVTTGTLTDALPIAPGETWTSTLDGITLPGLSLSLESRFPQNPDAFEDVGVQPGDDERRDGRLLAARLVNVLSRRGSPSVCLLF